MPAGDVIQYYPPCPNARMGSEAPSMKMMKTLATPVIVTYQHKRKTTESKPANKKLKAQSSAPK